MVPSGIRGRGGVGGDKGSCRVKPTKGKGRWGKRSGRAKCVHKCVCVCECVCRQKGRQELCRVCAPGHQLVGGEPPTVVPVCVCAAGISVSVYE